MMNGTEDDMIEFIDTCRKEFKTLPPEDISFPRSASDVVKYKAIIYNLCKGNTHAYTWSIIIQSLY